MPKHRCSSMIIIPVFCYPAPTYRMTGYLPPVTNPDIKKAIPPPADSSGVKKMVQPALPAVILLYHCIILCKIIFSGSFATGSPVLAPANVLSRHFYPAVAEYSRHILHLLHISLYVTDPKFQLSP